MTDNHEARVARSMSLIIRHFYLWRTTLAPSMAITSSQNTVHRTPYTERWQILNRQTFKAISACELINLTSLVGKFYAECFKCLMIQYIGRAVRGRFI